MTDGIAGIDIHALHSGRKESEMDGVIISRGDIYELGGWTLIKALGKIFKFEVRLLTELKLGFET